MGGVGFTKDYPIEKFYRDCKVGEYKAFYYIPIIVNSFDTVDFTVIFWIHITPFWNWWCNMQCFSQCTLHEVTSFISHSTKICTKYLWNLQILLLNINASFWCILNYFQIKTSIRVYNTIEKIAIVVFKMCFSLINQCWTFDPRLFISKFFDNVGRVYNKFIIITITWSEMPNCVSLTGADY